eukprot:5510854-Pleurochrysis_carterae.AAC.2
MLVVGVVVLVGVVILARGGADVGGAGRAVDLDALESLFQKQADVSLKVLVHGRAADRAQDDDAD